MKIILFKHRSIYFTRYYVVGILLRVDGFPIRMVQNDVFQYADAGESSQFAFEGELVGLAAESCDVSTGKTQDVELLSRRALRDARFSQLLAGVEVFLLR